MEVSQGWQSAAAKSSQDDYRSLQEAGRESGMGMNSYMAQNNMGLRAQAIQQINTERDAAFQRQNQSANGAYWQSIMNNNNAQGAAYTNNAASNALTAKAGAAYTGSQTAQNMLETSTNAQDLQAGGYSTDPFRGQRYSGTDGIYDVQVNDPRKAAMRQKLGMDNRNQASPMLGDLPVPRTAPAISMRSDMQDSARAQMSHGADPSWKWKPVYGSSPAAKQAAIDAVKGANVQPAQRAVVAPNWTNVAVEQAAPTKQAVARSEPAESARSNADWNAWVAYQNRPAPPSREDQMWAMSQRMGPMAQKSAQGMAQAYGALTGRENTNLQRERQAIIDPSQARQNDAQARYYTDEAEIKGGTLLSNNAGKQLAFTGRMMDDIDTALKDFAGTPDEAKQLRADREQYRKAFAQLMQRYPQWGGEGKAEGGIVGYAGGGMVEPAAQPDMLTRQYGQYVSSAMRAGVQPLSMEQFTALLLKTRTQMAQAPAQAGAPGMQPDNPGSGASMGFAGGGAIDVAGRQVLGPGDGKSDSIPAVIDGAQPAKLSTGEFVFPVEAVQFFGMDRLNKMVAAARKQGQNA